MPRDRALGRLIEDAYAAVRFLAGYLDGRRGYTARDVRAGAVRLAELCRRIEHTEPSAGGTGAAQTVIGAADECLRRVRERLG